MVGIYKNIEYYNPKQKRKILIVFGDMIADVLSNKKNSRKVTELVIRGRKLNISLAFIRQSFFAVSKDYFALPYSFLVIDITLASDKLPRFRKNLMKRI